MRKFGIILIGAIILVLGFVLLGPKRTAPNGESSKNISRTMTITSSAFEHNGKIPVKYACDGKNINPPLTISGVPGVVRSLVLIMDDPDAPGGTFTHWLMWNISVAFPRRAPHKDPTFNDIRYQTMRLDISENDIPEGAFQGQNSEGKTGYMGPCPPLGTTHRYFFKVYALDFKHFPSFETVPTKENLERFMQGHIIAQAELMGTYAR